MNVWQQCSSCLIVLTRLPSPPPCCTATPSTGGLLSGGTWSPYTVRCGRVCQVPELTAEAACCRQNTATPTAAARRRWFRSSPVGGDRPQPGQSGRYSGGGRSRTQWRLALRAAPVSHARATVGSRLGGPATAGSGRAVTTQPTPGADQRARKDSCLAAEHSWSMK